MQLSILYNPNVLSGPGAAGIKYIANSNRRQRGINHLWVFSCTQTLRRMCPDKEWRCLTANAEALGRTCGLVYLFIYFFKIGSKEIQKPPCTEAQSESLQVEITLLACENKAEDRRLTAAVFCFHQGAN